MLVDHNADVNCKDVVSLKYTFHLSGPLLRQTNFSLVIIFIGWNDTITLWSQN